MSEQVVHLTKLVQAHGAEVTALTFREPTGRDMRECGNFFRVVPREEGGNTVEFDAKACARMISALAGVPPSTVDALSAVDFMAAQSGLLSFFMEATPKTDPPNLMPS